MAAFGDLNQYLDPHLTLPIKGRDFVVEAPSANEGLRLKARVLGDEPMTDLDETKLAVSLLGGRYDEKNDKWVGPKGSVFSQMMNHADWDSVYRAAKTALIYFTISREIAEIFWQTGEMFADPSEAADPSTVQ